VIDITRSNDLRWWHVIGAALVGCLVVVGVQLIFAVDPLPSIEAAKSAPSVVPQGQSMAKNGAIDGTVGRFNESLTVYAVLMDDHRRIPALAPHDLKEGQWVKCWVATPGTQFEFPNCHLVK
jgi:hypothetical protein